MVVLQLTFDLVWVDWHTWWNAMIWELDHFTSKRSAPWEWVAYMCVANVCHHLSGLAWQFLVPGHYQNWWLHWLLIIKMSVSQIHDIWIIYFVSQWVGGWEIRFPKSHGSYPDNVCKLQLYGTYMYVIIGCQYLSGLDCHFFFLTLNTPSWKFLNVSFALSLLMSWCQTTVHHQQQCFICDRYMNFIIKKNP